MQKILVLNSGSSSLKYQLFDVEGEVYKVVAQYRKIYCPQNA